MERKVVLMVLISIFASLAVGIAVGMELVADPSMVMEQTRWLLTLEQELSRIRSDAVRLQQEVEQHRADRNSDRVIEQWLAHRITAGTLVGLSVALVAVGDTEALSVVSEVLTAAGADVIYSVTLDPATVSADSVAVCSTSLGTADVAVVCYADLQALSSVVPAVSSHGPVVMVQLSGQRVPVADHPGVVGIVGDIDRGTGAVELCDVIGGIVNRER